MPETAKYTPKTLRVAHLTVMDTHEERLRPYALCVLIDAHANAWKARERVLNALARFIRDSCYKHGRGDDACSCDWLDETLAGTTRSPAKGEEKGVTK